jgi:hypothetical protein
MKNKETIGIIITFGAGSIENGFETISIERHGKLKWRNQSSLPANPELRELLNEWQTLYPHAIELSGEMSLAPVFDPVAISNISSYDIQDINDKFKVAMNGWLNSGNFGDNINELRTVLDVNDRILIIIASKQLDVWRLPWHYWNFFTHYSQSVEVFCTPNNNELPPTAPQCNGRVNIIGLIGQDPKLNLNLDFLTELPQANPEVEIATSAYQIGDTLNRHHRDILIFNGHGNTIDRRSIREGIIYLDNDTPLEISRLKIEIEKAVKGGLQIAIFNCCSGLGIAEQLSDINIPYIIVMREKIPNLVAQRFLKELLTQYSQGDSFPEAFKHARKRLILAEGGFAIVADWLPILFHNPLGNHVTWRDLSTTAIRAWTPLKVRSICSSFIQPKNRIWTTLGVSFCTSLLALSLQPSFLAKIPLEENIINYTQATAEALISPERSQVTIVNYNDGLILAPGVINDDSKLVEMVEKVEQTTKPLIWGIDLEVDPQPKIFERSNIVQGCNDYAESTNNSKSTKCDRQLSIDTLLKRSKLLSSSPNNLNWNSNSLTENSLRRILNKIDRVDFSDISKKSPAEIKKLFDGKIVLVGLTDYQEVTSIVKKAIELDRIIRANRSQNPLPLPIDWSNQQKLLWVFGWSFLGGLALWHWKWKLLLPAAIGQIFVSVVCLGFGHGVPLVITSIAIILVGGAICTIDHLSLDRPA